jgi:hypothetical protein
LQKDKAKEESQGVQSSKSGRNQGPGESSKADQQDAESLDPTPAKTKSPLDDFDEFYENPLLGKRVRVTRTSADTADHSKDNSMKTRESRSSSRKPSDDKGSKVKEEASEDEMAATEKKAARGRKVAPKKRAHLDEEASETSEAPVTKKQRTAKDEPKKAEAKARKGLPKRGVE